MIEVSLNSLPHLPHTTINFVGSHLLERESIAVNVMGRYLMEGEILLVHVKRSKIQGQGTVAGSNL